MAESRRRISSSSWSGCGSGSGRRARASCLALAIVAGVAAYALVQRGAARAQARHAHGGELAGRALADIPTNPQVSVGLALRAAELSPGRQSADVLRSSLAAMRETRILRLGGEIAAASFAPRGERLLVASKNGRLGLYGVSGRPLARLPRQSALTTATWSPDGKTFATGSLKGRAAIWQAGHDIPAAEFSTPSPITALSFDRKTLLVGSGTHVRLVDLPSGRVKTIALPSAVLTGVLDPTGQAFAV